MFAVFHVYLTLFPNVSLWTKDKYIYVCMYMFVNRKLFKIERTSSILNFLYENSPNFFANKAYLNKHLGPRIEIQQVNRYYERERMLVDVF